MTVRWKIVLVCKHVRRSAFISENGLFVDIDVCLIHTGTLNSRTTLRNDPKRYVPMEHTNPQTQSPILLSTTCR